MENDDDILIKRIKGEGLEYYENTSDYFPYQLMPCELTEHIFSFFDMDTLFIAAQVSRLWNQMAWIFIRKLDPWIDKRQQIIALYGFDFPPDLYHLWNLALEVNPSAPAEAFADVAGISLRGPFDVLAGLFDDDKGSIRRNRLRKTKIPALMHWRYYMDPPEFFTVMVGETDGLHWGFWYDYDPSEYDSSFSMRPLSKPKKVHPDRSIILKRPIIASYYSNDAYDITECGDTLFSALEDSIGSRIDIAAEYGDDISPFKSLQDKMKAYLKKKRLDEKVYLSSNITRRRRAAKILVEDGIGVVVNPGTYQEYPHPEFSNLTIDQLVDIISKTRELAAEKPGSLLVLGKELWASGKTYRDHVWQVLEEAYALLNRNSQSRVLKTHRQAQTLPSLSVLTYSDGDFFDLQSALSEPSKVQYLNLCDSYLQAVPNEVEMFPNLETLVLSSNRIASLPDFFIKLNQLTHLVMLDNLFEEFPIILTELLQLVFLSLGNNRIKSIPSSIGNLRSLQCLNIQNNRIESIPLEIGNCVSLQWIHISNNMLTTLPRTLLELPNLRKIRVDGNPIEVVPLEFRSMQAKIVFP